MSAVMVDSFRSQQMPHRKPVGHPGPSALSQAVQTHSRTPSAASSTAYSSSGHTGYPQGPYAHPPGQQPMASYMQPTRRTLSNATTSTTSTSGSGSNKGAPIVHPPGLQRTASNRSGTSTFASQNSYVALMRKQKATVWCDRAQLEDPRLVAQRRAAKQRAAAEMAGSVHSVRLLSNAAKMRSKVRHHGQKGALYQPGNLSGSGIPMRLSASEVDEGDSEEFETGSQTGVKASSTHHQRTGSGRSSIGSGRKMAYNLPVHGRLSNASTPPSGHGHSPSIDSSRSDTVDETPVPADYASSAKPNEYFVPIRTMKPSTGSNSSGSRENSFGALGSIPQRASIEEERQFANDELRRRGSVDDRTMTLSGVRLFVANPDLSD